MTQNLQNSFQKIVDNFNQKEFIFDFLQACEIPKSTITKLRKDVVVENSERERETLLLINV